MSSDPAWRSIRDEGLRPHVGPGSGDVALPSGNLDSLARNALVLGILGLVFGVLTGLPAVWVGRQALIRIHDAEGDLRGRGAAWAGIVLGVLSIAVTFASLALLL